MGPYAYTIKLRLKTLATYRFDMFASIVSNIVLLVTSVFIWKAAYHGVANEVDGVSRNQMISYAVLSIALSPIFLCGVQDTINGRIREGKIAVDLIKPVSPLGLYFSEDVATSIMSFITKSIPILFISFWLFGLSRPTHLIYFFISCCLSYGVLWLLSALMGLVAFWLIELGNMGLVKDSLIFILSGSFVPLWFFPHPIQVVSEYLPFQYTFQSPLAIYIGQIDSNKIAVELFIQTAWIITLYFIVSYVWRKAQKKTLIQGG